MDADLLTFVDKWSTRFFDASVFQNPAFPDDCWAAGFKMDCGHSLIDAVSSEDALFNDLGAFKRAIAKVDDPMIVGNAIFSQWRYFNHWACSAPTPEDMRWFELAFARLAELAADQNRFMGS